MQGLVARQACLTLSMRFRCLLQERVRWLFGRSLPNKVVTEFDDRRFLIRRRTGVVSLINNAIGERLMPRRFVIAILIALCAGQPAISEPGPNAQEALRAARAGAIPLYDGAPPEGRLNNHPEQWYGNDAIALAVRNVSHPTLTPVLPPPGKATGAGVIVVPGGALLVLSMGNEGIEVAKALADRGIAAFVLKYRTEPTPPDQASFAKQLQLGLAEFLKTGGAGKLNGEEAALADAQQAFRMVRARAQEWRVDPARLGMVGFSAGAITVRNVVLANAPDARPGFAGLIYGQMTARTPPADAPPLFVALAADDPLFGNQGFALVESWRAAGRPAELHYYQTGDHGFGMKQQGKTSDAWFEQFVRWMDVRGLLRTSR
jgi:acetyl esterase/lipase